MNFSKMEHFKDFSGQSRVWIYQSDKEFDSGQKKIFNELAATFKANWESHGKAVKGSIELFYDRFIVLCIDEPDELSCGRSVDASVRFMKELEKELNVSLLNRMLVAYREGDNIVSCTINEFEKLLSEGKVNERTIVFNNMVHDLVEFNNNWELPVSESWHARLMPSH